MNSIFIWLPITLAGICLYSNIGYAYVQYMHKYNSEHSRFRRFLSGGWNIFENKPSEDGHVKDDFSKDVPWTFVLIWIIIFILSMISWVLWLVWKVVYSTFGGFAKDVLNKKSGVK